MKHLLLAVLLYIEVLALDFTVVPTLSSNPTSGTGLGVMSSIVYQADKDSSPSQTLLLASYTNSDSYNFFAINNMFFAEDDYSANTIIGYVFNNSEFDLSADLPSGITLPDTSANFQTTALIMNQQLLYRFFNHFYMGGQAFYLQQGFDSKNSLGSAFLIANGIENSSLGSVGFIANFDSRNKKEKLYPRDATLATFTVNYSPSAFGNSDDFTNIELDYRKYIHGFKMDDVVAFQGYIKTSSANTPDGSLPALGIKNILRGFSIGQYKARNLVALQGEYRYALIDTNFIFTTFFGTANLSGGSKGTAQGNRDGDNGYYSSGGFGAQYILQKDAGVNYRVDIVTTSKNEQSIYATVNQAF